MIPEEVYKAAQKLLDQNLNGSARVPDENLGPMLAFAIQRKAVGDMIVVSHAIVARYEAQNQPAPSPN